MTDDQNNPATTREIFFRELSRQLKQFYEDHKLCGHRDDVLKHRIEGFMLAGIRLELTEEDELHQMMEDIHLKVFGLTISERRLKELKGDAEPEDWAYYDTPITQRKPKIK